MTKTHTPGPWNVGDEDILFSVPFVQVHASDYAEAGFRSIANVEAAFDGNKHLPLCCETRANARLIAAAPELLEALEACVSELTELYGEVLPDTKAEGRERVESDPVLVLARAAIAKARGGA